MRALDHPRQLERLEALRSFDILDTPREERFDRIVELAAELCETPIAIINLVDAGRQWFKAETGLGVRETPLDTSICAHVVLTPGLTVIRDTLEDIRFRDNPLCIDTPNLRFYAGATLSGPDGLAIGTLCVLDHQPRDLSPRQRRALSLLADQVMAQLQLTRELALAGELRREVDHRVKNSLSLVSAMLSLQANQASDETVKTALKFARDRVSAIATIHDQLHVSNAKGDVDLGIFIKRLATSLGTQTRRDVQIRADVPSVMLPARDAVHAGIVVNELTTNALRHGFAIDASGDIAIEGHILDGRLRLSITDTGAGLPTDFDPETSPGLGMRLALTLTKQMGSTLEWSATPSGSTFTFEVPLPPAP